jgi:hypothetical protein
VEDLLVPLAGPFAEKELSAPWGLEVVIVVGWSKGPATITTSAKIGDFPEVSEVSNRFFSPFFLLLFTDFCSGSGSDSSPKVFFALSMRVALPFLTFWGLLLAILTNFRTS